MSVASEKIAQIFIPLVSGVNKNRWNERQSSCITLTTILTALSGEFFALRVRHSSRKSCLSSWSYGGGSGQSDPSRPLASHLDIRMWVGLQDYSYSSVLCLGLIALWMRKNLEACYGPSLALLVAWLSRNPSALRHSLSPMDLLNDNQAFIFLKSILSLVFPIRLSGNLGLGTFPGGPSSEPSQMQQSTFSNRTSLPYFTLLITAATETQTTAWFLVTCLDSFPCHRTLAGCNSFCASVGRHLQPRSRLLEISQSFIFVVCQDLQHTKKGGDAVIIASKFSISFEWAKSSMYNSALTLIIPSLFTDD